MQGKGVSLDYVPPLNFYDLTGTRKIADGAAGLFDAFMGTGMDISEETVVDVDAKEVPGTAPAGETLAQTPASSLFDIFFGADVSAGEEMQTAEEGMKKSHKKKGTVTGQADIFSLFTAV